MIKKIITISYILALLSCSKNFDLGVDKSRVIKFNGYRWTDSLGKLRGDTTDWRFQDDFNDVESKLFPPLTDKVLQKSKDSFQVKLGSIPVTLNNNFRFDFYNLPFHNNLSSTNTLDYVVVDKYYIPLTPVGSDKSNNNQLAKYISVPFPANYTDTVRVYYRLTSSNSNKLWQGHGDYVIKY